MTFILNKEDELIPAEDWIEANHPENGTYKVYWPHSLPSFHEYPQTEINATTPPKKNMNPLKYEIVYMDGKKQGESKGWDTYGTLKSIWNWKDGIPHGIQIEYYPDIDKHGVKEHYGEPRKSKQENYKDGVRHGKGIWWYRNGQKMKQEVYKNGIRDESQSFDQSEYGKKE